MFHSDLRFIDTIVEHKEFFEMCSTHRSKKVSVNMCWQYEKK